MIESREHSSYRQKCGSCQRDQKCRHRHFSRPTVSFLVDSGEVEESAVYKPLCDECYREIREVLIDRAEELEGISLSFSSQNPEDRPRLRA